MSMARLKFVVMDEGSVRERWFIDTSWSGTDRSRASSPSDLLPLRGGRAQAIELGFTADESKPVVPYSGVPPWDDSQHAHGAEPTQAPAPPDVRAALVKLAEDMRESAGKRCGSHSEDGASEAEEYWARKIDNMLKGPLPGAPTPGGFTADEPDPRDARIAELEADVERLRKRTHEIAEQKDREHAKRERQMGEMYARLFRARDWANASLVAYWTKDPHASWWSHGSEHNCMAVLGLLETIDHLAARLRADPVLPRQPINPEHAKDFISYTELVHLVEEASTCMRLGDFTRAQQALDEALARRAKETTT
jgi:hypothetical protein